MLGFKQFIEANSPEFNRRAEIISGAGNIIFNINDENKKKVMIDLYDLNDFHKVRDDRYGSDNFMKDIRKTVDEKAAVEKAKVGGGILEMKDNPANLHIWLDDNLRGKGVGGMIYEIAMEYATAHGKALVMSGAKDDMFTSKNAYKVWDHFYKNRQNVIPVPISKYSGNNKYDKIIAQKILDGLIDTGNRFNDRRSVTPEVIEELKEKYPTAFHAFKRNMYTIPHLQKAGKLIEINNIDELYKYFSKLVDGKYKKFSMA